jgi:transposase InsO family protein
VRRDRLGDGDPAHRGSRAAGTHDGDPAPHPKAGLLHHSDRGSQYAATSYQQLLTQHGIAVSMSRRGNCWDEACVESFFGTLKRELIYHRRYRTREEATQDIFEYIEVFYNRLRRHSTLGYYSPAEFEARTAVA